MSLFDRAARFLDDVLLLPDDVRETLEQAESALEQDVPEHAEKLFREVLAARPSLLRARQGLALALEARGDLASARAILAVSRQLDPDEPEVALLSARLALAAGDLDGAVGEARDAARRLASAGGASFAEACAIQARAELRRGRPDRAARELRKAIAVRPDDSSLRVELAEALAASGRGAQAAAIARTLEKETLDDRTAARLGLALFGAGEGARARTLLEQGARAGRPDALRALAQLCLAMGETSTAELHARMAVARGGGPDALTTLADVLLALDRAGEAAQVLLTASEARRGDAELLRRAARIVPLDQPRELVHLAERLEAVAPGDEAARAVRAWAELARGRADLAAALAIEPQREPRLALAVARLALLGGRPQDALEVLGRDWAFATADLSRVRALRRDALRALWRGGTGEVDLAAAIDEVARFAKQQGLDDAHRRALALRDELDRPLLLTILGEFNAGKSTLVNAFVGADVAPTGILPTTATLNLLRGGAERRVRVVRRDGTTREGSYEQLKAMLAEAEQDGVDHVEIVLPSELLERVWILDTPGSNAPVPEHEALAAEALRRADAALWIFDAGQAGKASEGRILSAIRASRRHVVAAVNKVDRLRDGQLEEVRASLARELPELGGDVVALSARRALKARLAGDDEAWVASGFPGLLERLERDVFGRSRQLKRRACGGRLLVVIDDALATERHAAATHEARAGALERAEAPLRTVGVRLLEAVDDALHVLADAQTQAFSAAADEVLAFVRPRTNRFAKHGTDLEDRAFLAEVIEGRLATATRACEARLVARVRALLSEPAELLELDAAALDRRVRGAVGPAIGRFAGYQSGLLAGGALRRFFEEDLPRAELERASLAEALGATRAHPSETLRPALHDGLQDLVEDLEQERARALQRARADVDRLRDRVYEPLRALREVLEELVE
jgi:GTPase Era involved in 16S rRNA processing/Flp pilus assembly protein TadD